VQLFVLYVLAADHGRGAGHGLLAAVIRTLVPRRSTASMASGRTEQGSTTATATSTRFAWCGTPQTRHPGPGLGLATTGKQHSSASGHHTSAQVRCDRRSTPARS
jgi:hypothetical protein